MSTATILFPPPPPTTNTLSAQQRSHLIRSSKKLARVLGDTPYFIDADGSTPSPFLPFDHEPYSGRSSVDSISTSSSRNSSIPTFPSTSPVGRPSSWPRRTSKSEPVITPPILRLACTAEPPSRQASVLSSTFSSLSSSSSQTFSSPSFASQSRFALAPVSINHRDAPFDPTPPTTNNSARLAKMDRLRRKLGDDVPASLVFPPPPKSEGIEGNLKHVIRDTSPEAAPTRSPSTLIRKPSLRVRRKPVPYHIILAESPIILASPPRPPALSLGPDLPPIEEDSSSSTGRDSIKVDEWELVTRCTDDSELYSPSSPFSLSPISRAEIHAWATRR